MTIENFKLLMWKNYRLRRYHWFLTIFEILVPILITYFFASYKDLFIRSETEHRNETIEPFHKSSELYSFIDNIIYTPYTPFTEKLMKKFEVIVGKNDLLNITYVSNESALEDKLKYDTALKLRGIVFLNIDNTETIPEKLMYKVRDTDFWQTSDLYILDLDTFVGPKSEDSYLYKGFAGLQLALDTAFIELTTNQTVPELGTQGFPYPAYFSDPGRQLILVVIFEIIFFTLLFISAVLIHHMINEKASGIKELIKLTGINEWLNALSWFVNTAIGCIITYTFVTILLVSTFWGPAFIRCISPSIIWVWLVLFCFANIAMCFVIVAIFQNSSVAVVTYSIIFMGALFLNNINKKKITTVSFLVPGIAFLQGNERLIYSEINNISLTWTSLSQTDLNTRSVSMLFAFSMLIFDSFLFFILSYYISCIHPGKYGTRKPYLFFLKPLLNFKRRAFDELSEDRSTSSRTDENIVTDKYFEKPHHELVSSIIIKNLHKRFGKTYAIKGINLKIYRDEITALLGHNGAGKTTSIAILTGMMEPTHGYVYSNNRNILKNMDEFRTKLGLCPQENRLFPYLSVMDHLLFFGMLKGLSKSNAKKVALNYLKIMELQGKEMTLPKDLSGGMQRKLCLSISLMGNPEILVLDEPTSGLDVESRRKLWNLLKNEKKNRTVILSTHHMEEADALGDRIAIMDHGLIVCHGTPMFLKKAYDTGYQLTVTKASNDVSELTNEIEKRILRSTIQNESDVEIVYNLPISEISKFAQLFERLEEDADRFGIRNMGLSCTTMEQVFLKIGGISIYDSSLKSIKNKTVTDSAGKGSLRKHNGLILIGQQLKALFIKKWLYLSRNYATCFAKFVIPTVLFMVMFSLWKISFAPVQPLELSLKSYPNTVTMIQNTKNNISDNFVKYITEHGNNVINSAGDYIVKGLLEYGEKDRISFHQKLLLGAEFNESAQLLLYNKRALHSLPVAINTFTNVIFRMLSNKNESSITTINYPVIKAEDEINLVKGAVNLMMYGVIVFAALGFFSADTLTCFVKNLNVEHADGFKHIQLMSHVSATIYWLSNFIFDYTVYAVVILCRVVLIMLFYNDFNFIVFSEDFGVLILLLFLFGVCGLLFMYAIHHIFDTRNDMSTSLFLLLAVCSIFAPIEYFDTGLLKAYYLNNILKFLFPPISFFVAMIKFLYINLTCGTDCKERLNYFEFASLRNKNGILLEILLMIGSSIFYTAFIALMNKGYISFLINYFVVKMFGKTIENDNVSEEDDDVIAERDKVNSLVSDRTEIKAQEKSKAHSIFLRKSIFLDGRADESIPLKDKALMRGTAFISHGLKKSFRRPLKFKNLSFLSPMNWFCPMNAVVDVNFVVNPGQCFGLLGHNGAGKSTTFKILTGSLLPSKGDSYINGIKLRDNRTKYLSEAGYCAQTNCFLEELTGQELLSLIASLRGIPKSASRKLVDKWISIAGLEEYRYQQCGKYSGGNKRKLCTAMSLIGDPQVVFLDEPTTGVDPVSRRRLYDIMTESRSIGQAVILTSHSMEECENLCDRITIMTKGVMKCIGSSLHLKRKYAQGFSIMIKVEDLKNDDEVLEEVKEEVKSLFKPGTCELVDEHMGLLYYRINDITLKWSQLFQIMDYLKSKFNIIEDYTLTDTSLEEVFLSFIKKYNDY